MGVVRHVHVGIVRFLPCIPAEYFDPGYEYFPSVSHQVILDRETFSDCPGNKGHEMFSFCPIRAMKINGVKGLGNILGSLKKVLWPGTQGKK